MAEFEHRHIQDVREQFRVRRQQRPSQRFSPFVAGEDVQEEAISPFSSGVSIGPSIDFLTETGFPSRDDLRHLSDERITALPVDPETLDKFNKKVTVVSYMPVTGELRSELRRRNMPIEQFRRDIWEGRVHPSITRRFQRFFMDLEQQLDGIDISSQAIAQQEQASGVQEAPPSQTDTTHDPFAAIFARKEAKAQGKGVSHKAVRWQIQSLEEEYGKPIGQIIEDMRLLLSLPVAGISKKTGLSRRTVQRIMQTERIPALDHSQAGKTRWAVDRAGQLNKTQSASAREARRRAIKEGWQTNPNRQAQAEAQRRKSEEWFSNFRETVFATQNEEEQKRIIHDFYAVQGKTQEQIARELSNEERGIRVRPDQVARIMSYFGMETYTNRSGPEEVIINQEVREEIQKRWANGELSSFDPQKQRIIAMRYGISPYQRPTRVKDIAEAEGLSASAVKKYDKQVLAVLGLRDDPRFKSRKKFRQE